ncbi:hypothetical protein GCM10010518_44090 [Kitasatospora cinereorecta]
MPPSRPGDADLLITGESSEARATRRPLAQEAAVGPRAGRVRRPPRRELGEGRSAGLPRDGVEPDRHRLPGGEGTE